MTKTTTISSGSWTSAIKMVSRDLDGPKYNTGLAVKTEVRYVLNWMEWSVDGLTDRKMITHRIEDLENRTRGINVPGRIDMGMRQKTQYFTSLEEAIKFKASLRDKMHNEASLSKEVVTYLELSEEELEIVAATLGAMEIK